MGTFLELYRDLVLLLLYACHTVGSLVRESRVALPLAPVLFPEPVVLLVWVSVISPEEDEKRKRLKS